MLKVWSVSWIPKALLFFRSTKFQAELQEAQHDLLLESELKETNFNNWLKKTKRLEQSLLEEGNFPHETKNQNTQFKQ